MTGDTFEQVKKAELAITKSKHCSGCYSVKRVEGGAWVMTRGGKSRRWICSGCAERARRAGIANIQSADLLA